MLINLLPGGFLASQLPKLVDAVGIMTGHTVTCRHLYRYGFIRTVGGGKRAAVTKTAARWRID